MSHQQLTALCLFMTAYQIIAVNENVDDGSQSRARSILTQLNVPPGYHIEMMSEVLKHYSPNSYRLITYDEARKTGVLKRNSRVGGGVGKRNSNTRNGGKRGKRVNDGNNGGAGKGDDKPSSSTDDQTPVSEPSAKTSAELPTNVP